MYVLCEKNNQLVIHREGCCIVRDNRILKQSGLCDTFDQFSNELEKGNFSNIKICKWCCYWHHNAFEKKE